MAMPKKIVANAQYSITLTEKVKVGSAWLKPSQDRVVVKGSVLETIKDKVSDAQPID